MTENPYQSPEPRSTDGPVSDSKIPAERKGVELFWFVMSIAALCEGISSYWVFVGSQFWPVQFAFWATPVSAILFSTCFALWHVDRAAARPSVGRTVARLIMALLVPLAGYICFVTTCCCGNMMTNSVRIAGPGRASTGGLDWPSVRASIISAATMVVSCLLVTALMRLQRRGGQRPTYDGHS